MWRIAVVAFCFVLLVQGNVRVANTPESLEQYTSEWAIKLADGHLPNELEDQGFEVLSSVGKLPNTYVVRHKETHSRSKASGNSPRASRAVTAALLASPGVQWAEQQVKIEDQVMADPLFAEQWHIDNTGTLAGSVAGADLNVVPAWNAGFNGSGIVVTVVDQGYQYDHLDLASSYISSIGRNYLGGSYGTDDPYPEYTDEIHGTACAGIILAEKDNDECVVGIAYGAKGSGVRLIGGDATDADYADAYTFSNQQTHIYSNSYGVTTEGKKIAPMFPLVRAALELDMKEGRDGKGNIYVYSSGNGQQAQSSANYRGYNTFRYTITVGAIDFTGKQTYYSEPGACLLVCAPGGTPDATGGVRTITLSSLGDNGGDCKSSFAGTSASCPAVAGVIALILQANPNLGWRDVQYVLASTTVQNDPLDTDWVTNGGGFKVNHKYGFGLPDALAAVTAAKTHINLPVEVNVSKTYTTSTTIPDNDPTGVSITFDIEEDFIVESALLTYTIDHNTGVELDISLTSPAGTNSVLAEKRKPESALVYNNDIYDVTVPLYGPKFPAATITAECVKIAINDPKNCTSITRCAELNGKFAYLPSPAPPTTSFCTDTSKLTMAAQNCGAVGVITYEPVGSSGTYQWTGTGTGVTIPTVDIQSSYNEAILPEGKIVSLVRSSFLKNIYLDGWNGLTKRVLGESSKGTWTAKFVDGVAYRTGTILSAKLEVFGHYPAVVPTTTTTTTATTTTTTTTSTTSTTTTATSTTSTTAAATTATTATTAAASTSTTAAATSATTATTATTAAAVSTATSTSSKAATTATSSTTSGASTSTTAAAGTTSTTSKAAATTSTSTSSKAATTATGSTATTATTTTATSKATTATTSTSSKVPATTTTAASSTVSGSSTTEEEVNENSASSLHFAPFVVGVCVLILLA